MASRPRILITGSQGAVGRILRRHLETAYEITGVDTQPGPQADVVADAADEALRPHIAGAEAIIHLATGQRGGWPALVGTEIQGTRALLQAAVDSGCKRFILASSNHASDWYEARNAPAIWLEPHPRQLAASDPPAPTTDYGAAKVAAEAIGARFALSEPIQVSCLRIGTIRDVASIEEALATEDWTWLSPDPDLVRARLAKTWCSHSRLVQVVREELARTKGRFVIRYATSGGDAALWSDEPYVID